MNRPPDADRFLESWLAEGPSKLPDRVVDAIVVQLDETKQRKPFWLLRRETMNRAYLAAGAVAAIALVAVIGIGLIYGGGLFGPAAAPPTTSPTPQSPPSPSPTPSADPVPSASPLASRSPQPTLYFVHGWPTTGENPAGQYSWDGSSCAGANCIHGFMHNGYGSGDVSIRINVVPEMPNIGDGATAVTVAGHYGIYRGIAGQEEWVVDIEGTTISIRLTAEPGTSQADLDEAHAIIDSMRYEPIRYEPPDDELGFRLVFTLTTDDWDSG